MHHQARKLSALAKIRFIHIIFKKNIPFCDFWKFHSNNGVKNEYNNMKFSEEKFIEVLENNQGIVRKVANSYCKNASDRDDLIQEITIQLWKSWKNYNPEFKISTWIYKIALNVAISFFRRTYRQRSIQQTVNDESVFIDVPEDTEVSENIKILYHYISELDELNKALILLYLDKYGHEEIAATLGISKTNVATKISRIKNQLKEKFNTKGN